MPVFNTGVFPPIILPDDDLRFPFFGISPAVGWVASMSNPLPLEQFLINPTLPIFMI